MRPSLSQALSEMNKYKILGYSQAEDALEVYDDIKQQSGEFIAGHFIIEVVLLINQDIREKVYNG